MELSYFPQRKNKHPPPSPANYKTHYFQADVLTSKPTEKFLKNIEAKIFWLKIN